MAVVVGMNLGGYGIGGFRFGYWEWWWVVGCALGCSAVAVDCFLILVYCVVNIILTSEMKR